jgi:hypothetical protein
MQCILVCLSDMSVNVYLRSSEMLVISVRIWVLVLVTVVRI